MLPWLVEDLTYHTSTFQAASFLGALSNACCFCKEQNNLRLMHIWNKNDENIIKQIK